MVSTLARFCWSLSLSIIFLSAPVFAAGELARDVEALRNSLPLKDPARPTLTLRLADVLFDEANALGGQAELSVDQEQKLGHMRRKALGLYQEALKGTQFHPPLQGQLAIKVRFQLARLMSDLGDAKKAEPYWIELVKQDELQTIKREAALQLAEYYDKQNSAAAYREADKYYQLAIELCGGGDVCSYAHYRRAWSLRDQRRMDAAIEEMQKALYDAKGQPREESLRDLITFLAEQSGDGERAMLMVEELVTKTARTDLFEQLADGFYSNGNRVAGTRVLAHVNQREPGLNRQIRLLEEYYGLRDWDKFHAVLDQAMAMPKLAEGLDPKSKSLLKRLSVQLDGERISRPQFAPDFQKTVELFLKQDPKSDDRLKMLEGWLASESDPNKKMDLLKAWASSEELALTDATKVDFRVRRLRLAGKEKNNKIVEEEAGYLATVPSEAVRREEYLYLQSYAVYEQERYDDTVALLKSWVAIGANPSDWMLRGQLLLVDILVKQKKYDELVATTTPWIASDVVASAAKKSKQADRWKEGLALMTKVRDESEFELAAGGGETEVALEIFARHCFSKRFLPKSCDNARVLSVKLKKQPTLIKILKEQNRHEELAAELEASGFFDESAAALEKLAGKTPSLDQLLKISLLYELGGDDTSRDRVLKQVVQQISREKTMGDKEPLIRQTLADAGMLDVNALKLPWSEKTRLQLTDKFYSEGRGNRDMEKVLLSSMTSTGPAWSGLVLAELEKKDAEQRKVNFYGAQSKRKFQQRLNKLQALDALVEKYFPGADSATRTRMAALMVKSYSDLSAEILAAPPPKDLPVEMVAELNAALQQMAQPFQEKAGSYSKIAREQLVAVADIGERAVLEALLLPETTIDKIVKPAPAAVVAGTKPATTEALGIPPASSQVALRQLHEDPTSKEALKTIQDYYAKTGNIRLSSYFQGRLLNLGAEEAKP
jgi:tetratricopeptide (TPR) repeat protein